MESDPKVPEVDLFGQVIERLPVTHEWTLELVRARKPEIYRAVVACLSCQIPIRHICEQLGVSPHTVMLIRDVDAAQVATQTRAYAERLRCQSAQAAAHAMSALPEATAREAAQVSEILLNQSQILMGQPTEISQVAREAIAPPDAIDAAWQRIKASSIQVTEVKASDCVSDACSATAVVVQPSACVDHVSDTGLDTPPPWDGACDQVPASPPPSASIEPEREGGGVGSRAGHPVPMGQNPPKEILPREVD